MFQVSKKIKTTYNYACQPIQFKLLEIKRNAQRGLHHSTNIIGNNNNNMFRYMTNSRKGSQYGELYDMVIIIGKFQHEWWSLTKKSDKKLSIKRLIWVKFTSKHHNQKISLMVRKESNAQQAHLCVCESCGKGQTNKSFLDSCASNCCMNCTFVNQ